MPTSMLTIGSTMPPTEPTVYVAQLRLLGRLTNAHATHLAHRLVANRFASEAIVRKHAADPTTPLPSAAWFLEQMHNGQDRFSWQETLNDPDATQTRPIIPDDVFQILANFEHPYAWFFTLASAHATPQRGMGVNVCDDLAPCILVPPPGMPFTLHAESRIEAPYTSEDARMWIDQALHPVATFSLGDTHHERLAHRQRIHQRVHEACGARAIVL